MMILIFWTDRSGQTVYRNDLKFLDRYAWANSADPDQTAPRGVWTHYSTVKPHSSNFRLITTNFLGARIFRNFTVYPDLTILEGSCLFKVYTVCHSVCIF